MMSFARFRLAIVVRGSFSTANFRSAASKNLIGACGREAPVPSSMKGTAPTIRSWSSMGLDEKEGEKQIDGSEKIAKEDGMGEAARKRDQVDLSKFKKFRDEEFLKCSWEEGRVREVFQEWKEAYERVYANAEEEEMRFRRFESLFKRVVEINSEGGSSRSGLNQFSDRTDDEMSHCTGGFLDWHMKMKASLEQYYREERVAKILPVVTMMLFHSQGQIKIL